VKKLLVIAVCAIWSATLVPVASAGDLAALEAELARITSRIEQVTPPEKGLPDSDIGLVDEKRAIDDELSELRYQVSFQEDAKALGESVAKAKATVRDALSEIQAAECSALPPSGFSADERLEEAFVPIWPMMDRHEFATSSSPWLSPRAPWFEPESAGLSASERCERWKEFAGTPAHQEKLLNYFDLLASKVSEMGRTRSDVTEKAKSLVQLLEKRREIVEKKLSKLVTKADLTANIYWVIALIGAFSIGAILAVKLFSDGIQTEWVASGQVIQFVTVMILLSVIMALGLAGVLNENTLGTLLGGIAGYVLAQGVGRAAAREVSRGHEALRGGGGGR